MKNIPKQLLQSKLLCFTCDLSNIQKFSFKEECLLTWVALLIVFLPIQTCLHYIVPLPMMHNENGQT
jgi:hypothetical protein